MSIVSRRLCGSRRRYAAALAVAVTVLAGCSQQGLPQPSPRPSTEAVPVLSSGQLDTVIERVTDTVARADAAKDATLLATVADGPALAERTAAYTALAKNPELKLLAPVGAEQLQDVVPREQDWPRTAIVVTRQNAQDTLPQLLVLTQRAPRELYKLTADVPMLGGAQLPLTDPIRDGVGVRRAGDGSGLLMSPRAALDLYASVLTQGTSAPDATKITASSLTEVLLTSHEAQVKLLTVSCPNCFKVTTTVSNAGDLWAFDTADGGALVVGQLNENTTIEALNGFSTTLSPEAQALTGVQKITKQLTQTRMIMVGIYVPTSQSKDPISVVAGQNLITAATAS